ncbi:MAG: hypothetical protein IJU10_02455 [Clostridia bacterium]|nr:hypothetical protein [Clostridia bacterium]
MNCLLVVNTLSGNASKVREDELIEKYAAGDSVTVQYIRDEEDSYSVNGVDKLIVCGGDGTLNHAINLCRDKDIDIYYLPFGTFNETAKGQRRGAQLAKLGRIADLDFAYVAAAGSFTDIGYSLSTKTKRRYKVFAYFSRVLKSYKVHRIQADISFGDISESGVYTLIMLSNARRCFGFRFNRLHRDNTDELQLITVKAPKKDGIWGRIKMFFPFFRVFFIGTGKDYKSKNIRFLSVKNVVIDLKEPTPFCVDGECRSLSGEVVALKTEHKARVYLIKP